MKRGQALTTDFFMAYALFLVLMMIITAFSLFVSTSIRRADDSEALHYRISSIADHITYGNLTTSPYALDRQRADEFFSKTEWNAQEEFHVHDYNCTIRVLWPNRSVMKSIGSLPRTQNATHSQQRYVSYGGDEGVLEVMLWG
ncbi:MAG: hypothetical protein JW834_01525 [Candidatus Diapherotrites archaeon]|nr:hypothetical protein [Candidatus Diapherotrites archaeon]